MKFLKWLFSRIRNTICLLVAWLCITVLFAFLAIAVIGIVIVGLPCFVLGLALCVIYLCITCWFRIGEPEWIKILKESIKDDKNSKKNATEEFDEKYSRP